MQIIKRGGGDLITSKESKMTCNNGGVTIESLIAGLLLSSFTYLDMLFTDHS